MKQVPSFTTTRATRDGRQPFKNSPKAGQDLRTDLTCSGDGLSYRRMQRRMKVERNM